MKLAFHGATTMKCDLETDIAITARAEAYIGKSYTSGRINTLGHFTRAGRRRHRPQIEETPFRFGDDL